MRRTLLILLSTIILSIYLNNTSWIRSKPEGKLTLLAHRGVHQNYSKKNLSRDDCTASRIDSPTHDLLENTIESIEHAFTLGADIVEIDIHPTSDEKFAVFHDWTIDCRTEGKGITRKQSLEYLQSLDIGYGYTHDNGKTFPFRGKGIGKMPSLTEVLNYFPDHRFLINIKSKNQSEINLIKQFLKNRPNENLSRLSFYGNNAPINRLLSLHPKLKGFNRSSIKKCVTNYELVGWTGYIPKQCRNTMLLIPIKYTPYIWGWPHLFVSRMKSVNTDVILVDQSDGHTDGIDDPKFIKTMSKNYRGIVWTDKIERASTFDSAE